MCVAHGIARDRHELHTKRMLARFECIEKTEDRESVGWKILHVSMKAHVGYIHLLPHVHVTNGSHQQKNGPQRKRERNDPDSNQECTYVLVLLIRFAKTVSFNLLMKGITILTSLHCKESKTRFSTSKFKALKSSAFRSKFRSLYCQL